ncbi:hypothetical protein MNBD_GAMMA10-2566 [hydrothermal vent metagenome]|uniref:Uncharacterized protein n=1 Tax=hydrothermal vent metagenome TaxID=652676 RepID=A0A3B0Y1R4_9ZZZZ
MKNATPLNTITDVCVLQTLLDEQGGQYLLSGGVSGALPSARAYLQFEGCLQGNPVVWNACILTLEAYAAEHAVAVDPQQSIEIEVVQGVHWLKVALNVAQIDRAVIERTIIMIRKYKRLRAGRHEYGARSKTQ